MVFPNHLDKKNLGTSGLLIFHTNYLRHLLFYFLVGLLHLHFHSYHFIWHMLRVDMCVCNLS
jgi:hypothetical protein